MQKWIDGEPTEVKAKSAVGGTIEGLAVEHVVLDADSSAQVEFLETRFGYLTRPLATGR